MNSNGWVDWARYRDGPTQKTYGTICAREGLVLHSMEGWLAGSFAELDKPDRSASWTFSLGLDGVLYQHFPVTASTWASGNAVANTRFNALELEGLSSMPINDAQIATLTRLVAELGYSRGQLYEHRQVWNMAEPNAGPTACPSERYAPFYAALEDDMTPQERQEHEAIVAILGGREKLLAAQQGGMDFLLGYAIEQADQDQLEAAVAALASPAAVNLGLVYSDIAKAIADSAKAITFAAAAREKG